MQATILTLHISLTPGVGSKVKRKMFFLKVVKFFAKL